MSWTLNSAHKRTFLESLFSSRIQTPSEELEPSGLSSEVRGIVGKGGISKE